jgi:murein DD-endopeptidase MepM/ murein hydrolase activator NlpD
MNRSTFDLPSTGQAKSNYTHWLFFCACCLLGGLLLLPAPARAQAPGEYTVAPGDTLGAIATRFGVTLDALVAANAIADPNQLAVGQVLAIPTGSDPAAIAVASGASYSGETSGVRARPGDTITLLAVRYGQDPALVAGLNGVEVDKRLFPGQPVQLPAEALPSQAPAYFGAITGVELAPAIVQGRTGHVYVDSVRPLALTATWLGQPVVFTPLDAAGLRQFALLPVGALQEPGAYEFGLSYTTARGAPVSRMWTVAVEDGGYESQQIVVSDDKAAAMTPEIIAAERDKVVGVWSQVSPALLWSGPFVRPIDPQYLTTSSFGTRRDYSVADIGNFHAGQDFGAPEGVLVTAPADGVVALAEPLTVRGNAVILDHGRGIFTGYWHLSEIRVTPGQRVAAGDILGIVGNTGLSTGAHLHWEMRIYGVAVDPMQFLEEGVY